MARILVVDDTQNIRKMVRLTLEHEGHTVQLAEDGAQGLELFGDGSGFDLTLVDQRMPRIEGATMIAEARQRDPLARIVMMTAFATDELAALVLETGAADFLRKPFSTDILRATVEAALAHPRERAAEEEEISALPEPGQEGFSIPRLSFRLNGFSFWPVPASQGRTHSAGAEFGREFQVRSPNGALTRCFVGLTPHIYEQAQLEAGGEQENDLFWERLCGLAVLHFLWEKKEVPPEFLPVYELPKAHQNWHSSRSFIPWGPFGG